MNKKLFWLLIPKIVLGIDCKIINQECSDRSPTKVIDGLTFTLSEVCTKLKLSGDDCCWNSTSKYYCGDQVDTCNQYRKNANCFLIDNTCIDKDYITGRCNKFQSKYSCAGGYVDVESRVCTNVVCANHESGTATKCFGNKNPSPDNVKNMGSIIAYLQAGQSMAQDMNCKDMKDPSTCTLFSGKYFVCYMYMFKADQPSSWNNNGADCTIHSEFFSEAGVPTGYNASDRALYSQATSGTNSVMGGIMNYGMSIDNSNAINNSVKLQQQAKAPSVNQDQMIDYATDKSRNSKVEIKNGQVVSISINKDMAKDVSGFTSFKNYLTDKSINLAWNRQKSEPNPSNIKSITFADMGIMRNLGGKPFGWSSGTSQPLINGLCVHFSDYCEGGDDSATSSDLIKAQLSWAGGFTNPNFCAYCTSKDPFFNNCLTGEPRNTKQQWCCFSSKIALAINLAAYDQGLLNFYTGNGSRYVEQINHDNENCGGITVGMITKIDFSKGNYFKDLMDSIDINKIIDNTNFTNVNIQSNTKNRSSKDALIMINEWKKNGGN